MKSLRSYTEWTLAAAILSWVSVLPGCGEIGPMDVYSEWGPGVRFSEATSTYDWWPDGRHATGEGRPKNPQGDRLIREAIEKHLGEKGYTRVATETPDCWVDYRVGRTVRGDPNAAVYADYTEGALGIYILNPADQKLIWRGSAQARLDDSSPPDVQMKRLDAAVKAILAPVPNRAARR